MRSSARNSYTTSAQLASLTYRPSDVQLTSGTLTRSETDRLEGEIGSSSITFDLRILESFGVLFLLLDFRGDFLGTI